LARDWLHIAKAEFFVLTAGMREHRKLYAGLLYAIGIIWALVGAPIVVGGFVDLILSIEENRTLLMAIFPGLMRSVIMFLWIILLLFPMSKALEEIRISHWELFLSNNVKTRHILTGSFLGMAPLYGLVTLILAPIIVSPFIVAFEINLLGSVLIYGVIVLTVVTTLWLSNYLTAAIQSRLGDSSKGNDIAKALSVVIAVMAILPMYMMMYAAPLLSGILGMNVFLLMPFTWAADSITWLALSYNGVGLTDAHIAAFSSIMQLDFIMSTALMLGFALLVFGGSFLAADRVFTISAGARTEQVTTVGGENRVLRAIRSIGSPSSGALLVTNVKDYFRKAQNLSKMFYAVALAVIFPVMMFSFTDLGADMDVIGLLISSGMMYALLGAYPYVGVGFLESRDQLWILQGTPNGASKFVKARLAMAVIADMILMTIPVSLMTFLAGLTAVEVLCLAGFGLLIAVGSSMIAIGVTAKNPDYEDTKSPAHQTNQMTAMMLPMVCIMASVFILIALSILDLDVVIENALSPIGFQLLFSLSGPFIILLVGVAYVSSGIKSLSAPAE
jgi:hypothetical protein